MARHRILLVEDDPDVRPLLEHVLLGEGYRVDVATTAAEAASLLETKGYDLVLTDGLLPDGSGTAVADQAKARGIKAVIITGYALQSPKEEVERYEYILKPVRPRELLSAVARYLSPIVRNEPSQSRGGSTARLLVVDDDANVLEALCNMLSAAHAVERASDGFAALDIIEKDAPLDLLLTDIKMPGMHGFALARMAVARRPQLKVLYISGHLGEIGANNAAKFGPVLEKPIRAAELLRAIDQALAAPPARPH